MIEERNKSGNIILIVLLVLIILGLIGFIVYDKVITGDSIDSDSGTGRLLSSKSKGVENLEVSDPLVTGLLDKISGGMTCTGYEHLYMLDKPVNNRAFDNNDIYNLALNNLLGKLTIKQEQQITGFNSFTEEELEAEIESIVGKGYNFTHKTYQTCPQWNYDSATKTYVADSVVACGCTSGPYRDIVKTVKAEKVDNRIEIYQRIVFVDAAAGKGYSDFEKTREITDLVLNYENVGGQPIEVIDENNMDNYNKGALYKIVFEEQNNTYVFKLSELED